MRYVVALALLLVFAPIAQAEEIGSQWNDSNTVQLPGGPDTYPGDTSIPDQGAGGGGDAGQGTGAASAPQGGASADQGGSDIIIFSSPLFGDSGASSGGAGGTESDPDSLLNTLISSGAVSGAGIGVSGQVSGSSGASDGIFIDGAKVRAALSGKGILRVTLRAYRAGGVLSNSDLGLIGASTILKNPALESAFISLTRFDITYRSQGYLLGFLPVSFPVKISVNPAGATVAERVTIKFPWYSFFLRKFVSKPGLANDIDAIITKDADPSVDRSQVQVQIFTDVSVMLQSRVDSVEESVRSP